MNSIVEFHRQHFPNDTRSDEELTLLIGDTYPGQYDSVPDFRTDYEKLSRDRRMESAPSLGVELARGVRRSVGGLKSTVYGAGALAAGSVGIDSAKNALLEKAKEAEESAQENPPTIQGVQDIRSPSDFVRYAVGGAGEVVPSIVEAGAVAAAGALAGTAAAPGVGTAGGFLTGILERQAAKELIKDGIKEFTKEQLGKQLVSVSGRYASHVATALNSYALSAGELYQNLASNRNVDPGTALNTALLGGLVAAVPDTILPSYIVGKYFRGVPAKTANGYVAKMFSEAAKEMPIEALTEGFQEFVGIAAEKYADPTQRDKPLNNADWLRIANAAALGGLGGGLAGVSTGVLEGRGGDHGEGDGDGKKEEGKKSEQPPAPEPKQPSIPDDLAAYVGKVKPADAKAYADLAVKDLQGELLPQEAQVVENFNPERRNAYTLIKDQVAKQMPAEESAAVVAPPAEVDGAEMLRRKQFQDQHNAAMAELLDAGRSEVQEPIPPTPPAPQAEPSLAVVPSSNRQEALRRQALESLQAQDGATQYERDRLAKFQSQKRVEQEKVDSAAQQADPEPTEGQKESGNYRKGHVTIDGLDVTIENAAGSTRSGVDANGKPWSVEMPAHYGYVKGTKGKDGDHVDVYIGKNPASDKVFVVDQFNPATGAFDEHKVMLGFDTQNSAVLAYDAAFSDGSGPDRRRTVTEISKSEFKSWLDDGNTKRSFADLQPSTSSGIAQIEDALIPEAHLPTVQTTVKSQADRIESEIGRFQSIKDSIVAELEDHVQKLGEKYGGKGRFEYTASESDLQDSLGTQLDETNRKLDDLRVRLKKLQGPEGVRVMATADGLLDQLDFDRGTVSNGKWHNDIGAVIEDISGSNLTQIGLQLSRGSRPADKESNSNRSLTKRALAVRDNQTGRILILGAWKNGGLQLIANPNFEKQTGMSIQNLDTKRYTPLHSIRFTQEMKGSDRRLSVSEGAYNDLIRRGRETMATMRDARETTQAEMHDQLNPEKQQSTGKTEDEIQRDLHDIILEALPRDQSGNVKVGLSPDEFGKSILDQFEIDPQSKEAQRYAVRRLLEGKVDDKSFLSLNVMQQREHVLEELLESLYEAYNKGAFSERKEAQDTLSGASGERAQDGGKLEAGSPRALDQHLRRSDAPSEGRSPEPISVKEPAPETGNRLPDQTPGDQVSLQDRLDQLVQTNPQAAVKIDNWRARVAEGGIDGVLQEIERADTQKALTKLGINSDALLEWLESEAKFRTPTDPTRESSPSLRAAFHDLSETLRAAGVNVQLLQRQLDARLKSFFRTEGGAYHQASGTIAVVLQDLNNPTRENFRTLLHEAAHYLFASESPERRAAILKAIDKLSDSQLGIMGSADPRISEANPSGLDRLTLLEERLAEHLALNGEPDRSIASRIIRFIKDLYLRAAMAFQSTFLGVDTHTVNEAMALEYFKNHFARFTAGERSMTFMDFLGGPRWHKDAQYRAFDRLDGSTGINGYYDGTTGAWHYLDVIPDTPEAMRFNIDNAKLRKPGGSASEQPATPDQTEGVKVPHFVANNTHNDALTGMYDAWVKAGGNATSTGHTAMSFEDFVKNMLEAKLPSEVIAAGNDELTLNGKPKVNPRIGMTNVNPETQREAASVAMGLANKLYGKLSGKRQEAEYAIDANKPDSDQARFNKNALKVNRLTQDYTNAELVLRQVTDFIKTELADLNHLATFVRDAARNYGVLSQTVEQIEGKMDHPIARQYRLAINRLMKELADSPEFKGRFMDILTFMAQQKVDWKNIKTRDAKSIILAFAQGDPLLAPLATQNEQGKAMLSLALAFARSNQLAMDALNLRKATVTMERADANVILKGAIAATKDAISNAKKAAKKLPTLGGVVTSILDELESAQNQQRHLADVLQSHRLFIDMHDVAAPVLRDHLSTMEKVMGAMSFIFEPSDDPRFGKYLVPQSASDRPEVVLENKKQFHRTRDTAQQKELESDLRKMQAWLDAHPAGDPLHESNVYNQLSLQVQKITENLMDPKHQSVKGSFTVKLLGSISDKMKMVGLTQTVAIAKRLNIFSSLQHRWKNDAISHGVEWTTAERAAMKALGMPEESRDLFRDRYLDTSFDHITRRKDLLYTAKDLAAAETEALKSLKQELLRNPSTAGAITKPGAWDALEKYIRTTAKVSHSLVGIASSMGIKVEDEGIFRDVKGAPMFEAMRRLNGTSKLTYDEMAKVWLANPIEVGKVSEGYATDPAALRKALSPYFAGEIWEKFVKPLANRQGSAAFNAPEHGGVFSRAEVATVRKAFAATAPGDVVGFAENLYQLSGGTGDKGEFVQETLDTFNNFFKSLHSIYQQQSVAQKYSMEPVQHMLMNARVSDEFPKEWLEYRTYDEAAMRGMVNHLAYHAAFGRDMVGVEADFQSAIDTLTKLNTTLRDAIIEVQEKFPGVKPKQSRAELEKLVTAKGFKLSDLEQASRNLALVKSEQNTFQNWVKSQNGSIMELKAWSELMGMAVGLVVQGPATALTDTISMFKPLSEAGVSATGVKQVAQNLSSFAGEAGRSFLSMFGASMKFNADYVARRHALGVYDTANQSTLKERIQAIVHQLPKTEGMTLGQKASRATIIGARSVRAALGTGIGKGNDMAYGFKPHAIFTQVGQLMHAASIDGVWKTYEDLVMRAADYYKSHPVARANPNHEFTAEMLGYSKKFLGLANDEASFQYLAGKLQDYGLDLNTLALDYLTRKSSNPSASIMPDAAYQKLAVIGPNEIMLDSAVTNRPAALLSNPVLHFALPLVGWSLSQVTSTAKAFRGSKMELDAKTIRKGLIGFTAMMGMGLAYSLLRDEYDEDILGKKGNVLGMTPLGVIDRLSRVGTLGMAGDLINSFVNVETGRPVSVDSRVFAVSSLLGVQQAMSAWFSQGEATYASVWRPLAMALGGSGYLQYADIVNNALDLDNPESRVVARINAGNYLRSAGRELGMEVRTGRGMATLPTPMKPWITEMVLATYANSPVDFQSAYRAAVQAAKEMGNPDPVDYVKRSFQTAHPLRSVFKTAPSEAEYTRLLTQLSDRGRSDVSQAVRLFNSFGGQLGIKEFDGKAEKPKGASFSVDQLRTQSMGALRGKESFF